MKLTCTFSILGLLILGCSKPPGWTIDEYDPYKNRQNWPAETFMRRVSGVLDDPATHFCMEVNCLPQEMEEAFSAFYDAPFRMANPQEPFNCSCSPTDLPSMRLIFFAKKGSECVLARTKGGRACNDAVIYFKLRNRKLKVLHVVGGLQIKSLDMDAVKKEIENQITRKGARVGDFRFALEGF